MSARFIYTKGTDDDLDRLRRAVPEVEVVDKRPSAGAWWLDVILLWVAIVGVWPFADPGHSGDSVLSVLDLTLHWVAIAWLGARWRIQRQ